MHGLHESHHLQLLDRGEDDRGGVLAGHPESIVQDVCSSSEAFADHNADA